MKRFVCLLTVGALLLFLQAENTFAQRGRGGGFRGGRFGGRGFRGGFSGSRFGGSRSSFSRGQSFNRSSGSRASAFSRGSSTIPGRALGRSSSGRSSTLGSSAARLGSSARSGQRLGASGSQARSTLSRSGSASGRSAFDSPRSYQRPSQNELGSLLDLPVQGQARSAASSPRSASGSSGEGFQTRTFETPRGSTVTVGAGAGTATTPGGATVGAAGAGIKVEGPQGQTYVHGRGAAGISDGQRAAGAAGSISGVQTASGATAVRARGAAGVTDGQRAAGAAGSVSGARTASGAAAVHARGAAGVTDGTVAHAHAGRVTAIRDPAGHVVASGAAVHTYHGAVVDAHHVHAVRHGFYGYGWYWTPAYYVRYPGAWVAVGINAAAWWLTVPWGSVVTYCGCYYEPVSYVYGQTVIYEGDTVYYGEQPIATVEEYYEQATQIAEAGAQAQSDEWLPLGVFAVVSEGQTKPERILQLAVNKEGVIRGNLHDQLTDSVVQVQGAVDRKTQRVAFRLVDNPSVLFEAGLWNLTQDSLTLLIHFHKDRVEQRTLIRLTQPEEAD